MSSHGLILHFNSIDKILMMKAGVTSMKYEMMTTNSMRVKRLSSLHCVERVVTCSSTLCLALLIKISTFLVQKHKVKGHKLKTA